MAVLHVLHVAPVVDGVAKLGAIAMAKPLHTDHPCRKHRAQRSLSITTLHRQ